jgi:hypothetical protein
MVSRMKRWAFALLVPALARAQSFEQPTAPGGTDEREPAPIINGAPADDDDYPMAGAYLLAGGGFKAVVCSSTLIAPDVVLLAAHCVDPAVLAAFGFTGGAGYWSTEPDLEIFDGMQDPPLPEDAVAVSGTVFHEQFSLGAMQEQNALNYDIALAFLEEPREHAPLGVLPTEDEAEALVPGAAVSIVGWGQRSQNGPAGLKYWGESVVGAVSAYEFQVGPDSGDVRQCHGDSGGPTFLAVETSSSEKERVVGVTSHSWDASDCQSIGGVETRVDYYLDWIDDAMSDACADGTRSWCDDETGILPPPAGSRSTAATLGDGIRVAPVCGTVAGGAGAPLLVLALGLVGARRGAVLTGRRKR